MNHDGNAAKRFCFVLLLCFQASLTHACFLDGYGFSPGPGFHKRAATMSFNPLISKPAEDALFRLFLPTVIRGKTSESKALTVSYNHRGNTPDPEIQLFVDLMPGIKTVGSNRVELKGKSGEHTFMLQPQQSGIFRLIVTAKDINNKAIPELREAVYVKIFN